MIGTKAMSSVKEGRDEPPVCRRICRCLLRRDECL